MVYYMKTCGKMLYFTHFTAFFKVEGNKRRVIYYGFKS